MNPKLRKAFNQWLHHRWRCVRWELQNPERNREAKLAYRTKNPEKIRAANQKWYAKNRDRILEAQRLAYRRRTQS